MTNIYLLRAITLIHSLIVVFVLLAPFFGNNYFLFLHFLIIPFIIIHWILNQSVCSRTLTEQIMIKKIFGNADADDCVTCKIIQPIYDFKMNNKNRTGVIYAIVILLWTITASRLILKYKNGDLVSFSDLVK